MNEAYLHQYANAIHPDEEAFIRRCAEEPLNPLPHLVFADWLAEQGQEGVGSILRHAAHHYNKLVGATLAGYHIEAYPQTYMTYSHTLGTAPHSLLDLTVSHPIKGNTLLKVFPHSGDTIKSMIPRPLIVWQHMMPHKDAYELADRLAPGQQTALKWILTNRYAYTPSSHNS